MGVILIPGAYKDYDKVAINSEDITTIYGSAPVRDPNDATFYFSYTNGIDSKSQTGQWLSVQQENTKVSISYVLPIYTDFTKNTSINYPTYQRAVEIYRERIAPSVISRGLIYATALTANPNYTASYNADVGVVYDYDVQVGEEWAYFIKYVIYDPDGNRIDVEHENEITIKPVLSEFITLKNKGGNPLYIKFNEKLDSFKYNYADTITATLGSPYPFVRRNGYQKYRTFTLEGLISFEANKDFATLDPNLWKSYNAYDASSIQEKLYRDKVIEFLHDGAIKLYSSFQEGNMLIRLSNVSLTPNDQLSRHIWSFSATATEIAAATPDNIAKYGFN